MSLLWKIRHVLTRNIIRNSRKMLISHHCSEIDDYLGIIESLDNYDSESYNYYNHLIGDYLSFHLPELIKESKPMEVDEDLLHLISKRNKLVEKYNNWFYSA